MENKKFAVDVYMNIANEYKITFECTNKEFLEELSEMYLKFINEYDGKLKFEKV